MDEFKVQLFNIARRDSTNICTAVSDEEKEVNYYCSRDYSPVNTLDKEFAEAMAVEKPRRNYVLKQIRSRMLDKILLGTQYAEMEIDLLNVDVEGHELPLLKSLSFEVYKPKVLEVELHAEKIEEVLKHELYRFIKGKKYSLYSWVKPSLIFVRDRSISSGVISFRETGLAN